MYKNYEDKLNTILSNAKGEKVEKVELNVNKLKSTTKELRKLFSELKEFNKVQVKAKSDLLTAIQLINKVKAQALRLGIKFKDIPALVEAEKVYWPLNSLAKQLNII